MHYVHQLDNLKQVHRDYHPILNHVIDDLISSLLIYQCMILLPWRHKTSKDVRIQGEFRAQDKKKKLP